MYEWNLFVETHAAQHIVIKTDLKAMCPIAKYSANWVKSGHTLQAWIKLSSTNCDMFMLMCILK